MNLMKDSNIEWIGEIPEEWNLIKLKYLTKITTGSADTQDQDLDAEFPFYIRSPKPTKIGYYTHDETAILTAGDGDIGNIWHYVTGKFTAHQRVYIIDHFSGKINSRFLYYYFREVFKLQPVLFDAKTTVGSLRMSMLADFIVVLPPIKEQEIVAAFLDEKLAALDNIISKAQQNISTLEKYKAGLIRDTVTKGINKNIKFKDSGVDWIGEVPEAWIVKKLRYLGSLQNGISKDGASFGSGYPFVSYGDVYNNLILPRKVTGLIQSTPTERRFFSVEPGDVFFTRTSETAEEIGIISTCFEKIENATFAGFLIRFRPNEGILDPSFSKYYFSSDILRRFFVKEMMIVTRASLGQNLLKNLSVIIPPMNEQLAISAFLDEKTAKIEKMISKLEESIEISKQTKKSLIYEYVTGKKRVKS